ncbi:MAG: RNA-binding protein [Sphingobacteriaceae bacterium]|nr:MAG: RNA-binding protein [Sphingobacteriaceae bacterium]
METLPKIFLGGFPLDATELQLVQLVNLHGNVETIKIVRDKKTGKCKGYAFLEMKTKTDAEQAVEALDGSTYQHKLLSASIKVEEPAPTSRPVFTRVQRPGATDRPKRRRI